MAPVSGLKSDKLVIIIDDEYRALYPLYKYISSQSYDVSYILEKDFTLDIAKKARLIILDLKTSRIGAVGFIKKVKDISPDTSFLITTPTNVLLYKQGDFYEFTGGNLLARANQVLDTLLDLSGDLTEASISFGPLIGKSKVMLELYRRIEMVARTNITVLINGETGTGKELVAKTIHMLSERAKGPFVAINCGAIPQELVESELFGHERGAFTSAFYTKKGIFEIANGGTIFLDEIGDIDKGSQVKLLRVLQERTAQRVGSAYTYKTNVRVIAATSKDLMQEVRAGNFREDLFFRINVFLIRVPPLRERREDIPLLIDHFIEKYRLEAGIVPCGFTERALGRLSEYDYPGNVRELENLVQRMLVACGGRLIDELDVEEHLNCGYTDVKMQSNANGGESAYTLEEIEKQAIIRALSKAKGNRKRAAEILGITRRLLYLRLKKYDLEKNTAKRV